ncbi:MAG: uroporphyrinogen-III synthase, partial [Planctomycetota bacterium]
VRWGTTARQQVVTGTVGDIADRVRAAGLKPPALIVIGNVVRLREDLAWFERRPLFGRRIIVTRARRQASRLSDRLERLGAEVSELPTIRIEPPEDSAPLQQAAQSASSFDWAVFTSVNAVDALFAALDRAGLDSRALGACKVCAIGPSTAERLGQFGIRPDLQPPAFHSAAVCEALAGACDRGGARILYPRANIAPRDLPDVLASQGADVTDVVAYRTVPQPIDADMLDELFGAGSAAWITFTSSSTVRNFFEVVPPERIGGAAVKVASIGPATSRTLRTFGVEPLVEAKPHTIAGLVEAILESEQAESTADD